MSRQRRNFTGKEKMAILREHLVEKVPISEVCDRHGVQPTLLYQWSRRAGIRGGGDAVRPAPAQVAATAL